MNIIVIIKNTSNLIFFNITFIFLLFELIKLSSSSFSESDKIILILFFSLFHGVDVILLI